MSGQINKQQMKITLKTINITLIITALAFLYLRLKDVEKQTDKLNRLVENGQLKCKKPN